MADRQVRVKISAEVQGYIKGMEEASKATREVGSEAEKLAQQREAFNTIGTAALAMGTVAAAGAGLAIKKWADFDEAMSAVQAATHESAQGMDLLKGAALDAGARTVFSAEESANAIEELAKAGVSTADILGGGLDGALDLAAAGGLGVAEAAGIAATALKTFNLEGSDMSHVADLLAAGAGKAMGDVTDLSAALNQSAMVANATGLSIEETTATLSAFASQGLLGSDAGTSFKSMLQSLTPTSAKAAETMDELGISAYDAQGNFIGMAEFAGNLQDGLKDLSTEQQQAALKTIFGSDAIRAATVLYNEGEEGIREWTAAVDDQGYAAETAAARLDNLKGDLEGLGGALDTALIQTGSAANDVLRGMVQAVTDAVDVYNELPAPLQGAAIAAGVLTAGIGLLGGGALLAVPQIAAFKTALGTLGVTAGAAKTALSGIGTFLTGPWGVALMAAAGVAAVLLGEKQKMVTNAKELADTLSTETGAVTENSTAWAAAKLEQEGILEMGERLGISSKDMTDAWLGNADALATVNEQLDKWVNNADFRMENADWEGWSGDLRSVQSALEGSNEMLEEAKGRHERLKEATEGSSEAQAGAADQAGEHGSALEELTTDAAETEAAIAALSDEILGFGSETINAESAAIKFEQELAALNERVASGTTGMDKSTESGQANTQSLLDMANATAQSAAKTLEATGSQEEANAVLSRGREALINAATAYFGSRDAAESYINKILATPESVATQVQLNGASEAQQRIQALKDTIAGIERNVTIAIQTVKTAVGVTDKNADGGMYAYADGGIAAYVNGGIATGIYKGGAPIHKFAEPETGWEAYISGKPDQRDRNRQIWVETGDRLGMLGGIEKLAATLATAPQMPSSLLIKDVNNRLVGRMAVEAEKSIDRLVDQTTAEYRRARR